MKGFAKWPKLAPMQRLYIVVGLGEKMKFTLELFCAKNGTKKITNIRKTTGFGK